MTVFTTIGYTQSNAMATARDLFGSQSSQVLVKDEVAFQPARDQYQAIFEASQRLSAGQSIIPDRFEGNDNMEVRNNARLLSTHG